MGLFKTGLDNQTKLFTALAFNELQATEPFLNKARAAAYWHDSEIITINATGKTVSQSECEGKKEAPVVIDVANAAIGLPKSMDFDVSANGVKRAHVELSADLFGSGTSLRVRLDGKALNGRCSTDKGITTCSETIKDAQGRLLLRGHTVTDVYKNMSDFKRITEYSDPAGRVLGVVGQHVKFDQKANMIVAETWLTTKK